MEYRVVKLIFEGYFLLFFIDFGKVFKVRAIKEKNEMRF